MNQDSVTPAQNEDDGEAQREAAREAIRKRIEKNRALIQDEVRDANRLFNHTPNRPRNFLYGLLGERAGVIIGAVSIWLTLSSLFWVTTSLRWPLYYLMRTLDLATSARLVPWAPWAIWAIWGGIFGGCAGFCLVAPVYGQRDNKVQIMLYPLFAMAIVAILAMAFT